ncbi:MAG: bile acid:sodium symporter family protein [Bacteroidia bacterium]|nr:bile acid:sodium symporter family protein [Bacteroidia bacterium]
MNTVFIVLPILTLLMFSLGLTLSIEDFKLIFTRPKAVIAGLVGQIVFLPLVAFILSIAFDLSPLYFIGVMLIALSPGGSSSNIFSMLVKGDIALSVSLTALSSIITLFTIPLVLSFVTSFLGANYAVGVELPVGNLLVQNILLMLIPIVLGILIKVKFPVAAVKINNVLSKIAFPALILLASIFFIQHYDSIKDNIATLGICITTLILSCIALASLVSRVLSFKESVRRTIIIEVGMQNAAQTIAIASSPFIFNNGIIAIPAIIYALMMNVILLSYVGVIKFSSR